MNRKSRLPRIFFCAGGILLLSLISACSGPEDPGAPRTGSPAPAKPMAALAQPVEAIGIALEVEDGAGMPLQIAAGGRYFIDQIDLRDSVAAAVDRGIDGLKGESAFAALHWGTPVLEDTHFLVLPNADGTFTRRRFYGDADWIRLDSVMTVEQLDRDGAPLAGILRLPIGAAAPDRGEDAFFIRRLRAIQWTYDCPMRDDCMGAKNFLEEALVELRHARRREAFELHERTAALRLRWSLLPGSSWKIPVHQVWNPEYAYGFNIDIETLTSPGADGSYAPGSLVEFRITLRDGTGRRLHPAGSLPTYNEVISGAVDSGIQYYRSFFDSSTVYYRRKHRERMLMVQMIGPAQNVQPIRSVVPLSAFLAADDDVQHIGLPGRDGVFADFMTFPVARDLFGGSFDPEHAPWNHPVSDIWKFTIPPDAVPGTYLVTAKGRRVYLGQDIPFTRTIDLQVGTAERTTTTLDTGPCTDCHSGHAALANLLHANDNRAACIACHAPLEFELEGNVHVRLHFIHSRSDRFPAPLERCSTCHLTAAGMSRVSQSACLSCHKSYPEDHVAQFGPVTDMYVGASEGSFAQCTDACHATHPDSGFD
jgi:predicted CXXCH cytochrome family protein